MARRPHVPWDIVDMICEVVWIDDIRRDHVKLYLSLMRTCSHLLHTMTSLAWKYVYCRSKREQALYVALHSGSLLSIQDRAKPQMELHVDTSRFSSIAIGTPTQNLQVGAPRPLLVFSLTEAAPLVEIVDFRGERVPFPSDNILKWLVRQPLPPSTRLMITNMVLGEYSKGLYHETSLPIAGLTLRTHKQESTRWSRYPEVPFKRMFPKLVELDLLGNAESSIRPLLAVLPPTIRHLTLKAAPSPQMPYGSVLHCGLIGAIKHELGVRSASGARISVTVLTGPDPPMGWTQAEAAAVKHGISLKRLVVL
jgi:hypothetical protein